MPITAVTLYDEHVLKAYALFHINKGYTGKNYSRRRRMNLILMPFLIALMIALFALLQSTNSGNSMNWVFLFFILMISLLWGFTLFAPKLALKNNKNLLGAQNHFTFHETAFELVTQAPGQQSASTILYASLHKTYETKDFIYLYANAALAYIVDKRRVENGMPEQLSALLAAQMAPGKYVVSK